MTAPSNGELAVRIDGVDGRLKGHDTAIKDLWTGLDKLRNRIPVWCTLLLMMLSGIVGSAMVALFKG